MKLNKRQKELFQIIQSSFYDIDFEEDIFDVDVEYFGGDYDSYNQSSIVITKDYINCKVCLNEIEMDRFIEFFYDKKTKKLYSYFHYMEIKKTSFKKIKEEFGGLS